jgi:hypothetical protein
MAATLGSATPYRKEPLKGKGNTIFATDSHGRDDLRYAGKKLTDPINTVQVICEMSVIKTTLFNAID